MKKNICFLIIQNEYFNIVKIYLFGDYNYKLVYCASSRVIINPTANFHGFFDKTILYGEHRDLINLVLEI